VRRHARPGRRGASSEESRSAYRSMVSSKSTRLTLTTFLGRPRGRRIDCIVVLYRRSGAGLAARPKGGRPTSSILAEPFQTQRCGQVEYVRRSCLCPWRSPFVVCRARPYLARGVPALADRPNQRKTCWVLKRCCDQSAATQRSHLPSHPNPSLLPFPLASLAVDNGLLSGKWLRCVAAL